MRIRILDNNSYAGLKPAVGKMVKVSEFDADFVGGLQFIVDRSDLEALGCTLSLESGFGYAFSEHQCEQVNEMFELWCGLMKLIRKISDFMISDKYGFALVFFLISYLVVVGFRFQWRELLGWWFV